MRSVFDRTHLAFMVECVSQYDSTCRALAAQLLAVDDQRAVLEEEKASLLAASAVLREHEDLLARRIEALEDENRLLQLAKESLQERCRNLTLRIISDEEQIRGLQDAVSELVAPLETLTEATSAARSHFVSGSTTLAREAIDAGIQAARRHR